MANSATYVSAVLADANRNNPNAIIVTSSYLTQEGDTFILEKAAFTQNALLTTIDISTLRPEVSAVYPYKAVVSKMSNGSSLIFAPTIETLVTASQNYYASLKFERYTSDNLRSLDKRFLELEAPEPAVPPDSPGE